MGRAPMALSPGRGCSDYCTILGEEVPSGSTDTHRPGPSRGGSGGREHVPVCKGLWRPRTLSIPAAPARVGDIEGRTSPQAGLHSKLGVHTKRGSWGKAHRN